VLLLAACGGGGGGGGGGSGPDLSTAPGITVNPTSLSFAAVHNGAIPPTQSVQITISAPNAAFVGVAVPAANPPTWFDYLNQARLAGAGNNWTYTAAIVSTGLAPGTYTTTISIGIADAGQNVIAYRDVQVSYTVTPTPVAAFPNILSFSYVVGATAPAAQTTILSGDIGSWTASANQTWISVPGSGTGGGLVNISVNPTGLIPNGYSGTVTFSSGGSTATVNVTLTVAAPGIQTSQPSLSFSGINGTTLASQPLSITMNNGAALNWNASVPITDTWLVLNRTSGTETDQLGVSVNPANGPLASGTYNSTITLQGLSGGSPFVKTVNVTLTLTKATLTPSPVSVTLGGTNGRDFSGVPVQLSLNTGSNSFSWNSSASSFVQRSPSSGSISATPASVTFTPDATGLTGGTHSGSVTFTAQVNGDTVSINVPVTFNLESHKLLVDGNGVAFAKTPTLSKLTRTLKVRDNLGLAPAWTASLASPAPWLLFTGSGTAGDNLVLTADPTGLATDTIHFATLTIDSPDASVENRGTEKVRIGFWVGSADPTSTAIGISAANPNVAADPIRPYAYAAVGADIRVYNVYTGLLVNTITGVASGGGTIGFMTVSHDGSKLYAIDVTNSKIVPVDLDTQTAGTSFSVSLINVVKVIDYTRTNGVELIVSGSSGQIFNAQTGTAFPVSFVGNTVVTASRGGTRMCTVDVGISLYSISCPTLDFTSLNGGQLLVGNTFTVSGVSGNGQDVALKADGTTLYVGSGGVTELSAYSTSGQNPVYAGAGNSPHPTGLHPNNAELATDGRIFASAANPVFDPADVWVFSALGAPITTYKIAAGGIDQIFTRQLRVSGDGIRLITITGNPFSGAPFSVNLNFTTVGP
jgi:hypothetical protein